MSKISLKQFIKLYMTPHQNEETVLILNPKVEIATIDIKIVRKDRKSGRNKTVWRLRFNKYNGRMEYEEMSPKGEEGVYFMEKTHRFIIVSDTNKKGAIAIIILNRKINFSNTLDLSEKVLATKGGFHTTLELKQFNSLSIRATLPDGTNIRVGDKLTGFRK